MAAGAPAPVADIAQGKMMAPWFGGGEFNQYILQYAEESLFPAIQSTTLLNAYKEMVAPIMLEWDAQARLVESRANLGTGKSEEMLYYLPDVNGSPKQVKINYLFRLASSERKETLVVYMSDENTHVHRMVWGEPNLDISTIKIDSNQARDLALKAFLDSSLKGDNIYPQAIIREEMQVFYEIPDNAHWQIHLNQQGQKSAVYYVHVNFEAKVDMSQSPDLDSPIPPEYAEEMGEDFERERQRELEGIHQMYASAQIDAQSGAIISLDRPSYYFSRYYPGRPMLMTVEPVYEDSDPAAPPALEASKTP